VLCEASVCLFPVSPTTALDQPDIRDGMVRGATRAGRDEGGTVAGEAGDAVHARGLDSFRQGHLRQDGGEAAGRHRLARPRTAQHQEVMGRTPALDSASLKPLGTPTGTPVHLLLNGSKDEG
jgi:hypothetical protein